LKSAVAQAAVFAAAAFLVFLPQLLIHE
jgi:hypothetical protein